MSKKKDALLTPEELAAKKIRKSNGWTRFWAIVLAFVLVAGVFSVAKSNGQKLAATVESEHTDESNNGGDSAANANASAGWDSSNTATDNTATPSGDASSNNTAAPSGDASSNASSSNNGAAAPAANDAAAAAQAINAATAKAASAKYKYHRNCVIADIDVGSATDTLNGIIQRVDKNADLNSVVGGFLDRGERDYEIPAQKDDCKEKFLLKATQLKAEDLQNLKVDGNKYTFTIPEAKDPQKDNSTALSRLTNDFITHQEVADGVKDALGGLSFLLSVKSSTVVFKDIKVTMVIDNGNLKSFSYSYYMDVQKLELSVATGTGHGTVEGSYTF